MQIESLKASIISELPQVPFVIDQVGEAITWAQEEYDEAKLNKMLRITATVAKWVTSISEPNFYKTHLVIATLLSEVEDATEKPKFKVFDTASKSVENTLRALTISKKDTEERGCFNALILFLAKLAQTDNELLAVALYKILDDLKEITEATSEVGTFSPITPQDYITVLGYALVLTNLRVSGFKLLNYNQEILNEIGIILNTKIIY